MPGPETPDFAWPLQGTNGLYRCADGAAFAQLPSGLALARKGTARWPDLLLEVVRGNGFDAPYGVLQLGLRLMYPVEGMLQRVREIAPGATIRQVTPSLGSVGFQSLMAGQVEHPLPDPRPTTWNTAGGTGVIVRLDAQTASAVRQGLDQGRFPFVVVAAMAFDGLAARALNRVRIDVPRLHRWLMDASHGTGHLSETQLRQCLMGFDADSGVTISGGVEDHGRVASALADRWISRCGTLKLSPQGDGYLIALPLQQPPDGSLEWDLNDVVGARRTATLRLDPFSIQSELDGSTGAELVHELTAPTLSLGTQSLTIQTHLPDRLIGVVALGVEVHVPANPPLRPRAISKNVALDRAGEGRCQLQFSPREAFSCELKSSIVLNLARGPQVFLAAPKQVQEHRVRLVAEHFNAQFIEIALEPGLAAQVLRAEGLCQWPGHELRFEPGVEPLCLVLPPQVEATLRLELFGPQPLHFGPILAQSLTLSRPMFAEYGPQQVRLICQLRSGLQVGAFDLKPEMSPDAELQVMHFAEDRLERTWTWFAESIFAPGFVYRSHVPPGSQPEPWSTPFFGPVLRLNTQGAAP
jgi:hypothetical protein